jgi:antitoxin component of RelBE/YafQ-DinJ toxin-antitoxin module
LTAVRLGATKNGLPFEIQIPNEKTMRAIENSRQGKGKIFFPIERHMEGVLE